MGGPLRILHVVANMNRGGAETLLMNLYRHIDRSKIQFDFLTCKEGVFDEEIRSLGGNIHRIPHITDVGHSKYLHALDQFFHMHAYYKVVHSHMDKMSGFVLRAAKRANIPVRIAHSHNTRSEGGIAARLYKWYAGTLVRSAATHNVACSSEAASWMFPGREKSTLILQNGIACEQFAFSADIRTKMREELGIPDDCLVIGHVGRFNLQKNHAQLISIFHKLQQKKQSSLLLLVGDGPLRSEIEQKVNELGITAKVKFLGVRSDISSLLQAFDVFVFPSHHEGLPVTLVEAQAAGLPCIISDHITSEVDMGIHLVKFFSLKNEASAVEGVLEAAKQPSRMIPAGILAIKGYDIQQTALRAADYYLSHYEVRHEDINRVYAHV
ncbi:glycosyltransferase family 1 protein [Paenibacillus sp. LHD-38]|uniref:glycosyltransferase family 1 protein n=1 Tax=Paenibacillus sp. LHD-38 TaxID=3072143 RepID=UPI00280E8F8C|nr:glycosyltransferase family 1 protein [Paenibacillus sp. LHD-38]MDQ8735946.1 glycosyltransferase family 1 protein [Paenibacillus sp. LHD-38]